MRGSFIQRMGTANPLDGHDVGRISTSVLGDFDGDADLDLVADERDGAFQTYYLPEPSQGLELSASLALLGLLDRLRRRRADRGQSPSRPNTYDDGPRGRGRRFGLYNS